MNRGIKFLWLLMVCCGQGLAQDDERRTWRDITGSKSFEGDYVSMSDGKVTIMKDGLSKMTFPISKLHQDDQDWLEEKRKGENGEPSLTAEYPVFDTLEFGDNRPTVLAKLKGSELVTSDLAASIFEGAAQLSGNFRTTRTIGDLRCYLHFDWEDNALKQVDLRTDLVSSRELQTTLKESWGEMVELLNQLYGGARHKSTFPANSDMEERSGIVGTHRWITEHGAEVILGPSYDSSEGRYFVCVRITKGGI